MRDGWPIARPAGMTMEAIRHQLAQKLCKQRMQTTACRSISFSKFKHQMNKPGGKMDYS
jgi:hypothetical protein